MGLSIGLLAAAPWGTALGQNLDAGKPPSQIFSEVCANCHRSTREVRNATASFLREHYTTGSEMASSVAAYLASGAADRAPGQPAQPKRPPAPTTAAAAPPTPPAPVAPATARDAPAAARGRPPAPAEVKPVASAPAPIRPVLEEFEE
jgi:hypothetical protein